MTRDELISLLERNPQLSCEDQAFSQALRQRGKPSRKKALGDPIPGATESLSRPTIRFIGYRQRPLDPDNFARSCKDLLDGLRHAGLIHGDEIWRIVLQTEQCKVASKKEEKTDIEISYG